MALEVAQRRLNSRDCIQDWVKYIDAVSHIFCFSFSKWSLRKTLNIWLKTASQALKYKTHMINNCPRIPKLPFIWKLTNSNQHKLMWKLSKKIMQEFLANFFSLRPRSEIHFRQLLGLTQGFDILGHGSKYLPLVEKWRDFTKISSWLDNGISNKQ